MLVNMSFILLSEVSAAICSVYTSLHVTHPYPGSNHLHFTSTITLKQSSIGSFFFQTCLPFFHSNTEIRIGPAAALKPNQAGRSPQVPKDKLYNRLQRGKKSPSYGASVRPLSMLCYIDKAIQSFVASLLQLQLHRFIPSRPLGSLPIAPR